MPGYSRWMRFRAWCWNAWGLILLGESYGEDWGYYACKARARTLCPTLYPTVWDAAAYANLMQSTSATPAVESATPAESLSSAPRSQEATRRAFPDVPTPTLGLPPTGWDGEDGG